MTHSQQPIQQQNKLHQQDELQHEGNQAITRGNPALLAALGLQQEITEPGDAEDNQFISLSQELTGDTRLQAYLVTDYLSSLNAEETSTVANLLAEDTLAMLNNLANEAANEQA